MCVGDGGVVGLIEQNHRKHSSSGAEKVQACPHSLSGSASFALPRALPLLPPLAVLWDSSSRPWPMTENTALLELMGMQPLLAHHSRLPLGLGLWQRVSCGRTMGPYFSLLTQEGCFSLHHCSSEPEISMERTHFPRAGQACLMQLGLHKSKGHSYCKWIVYIHCLALGWKRSMLSKEMARFGSLV